MSKWLGIVPARAGSKRLPGKNKKKLGDKELVRYAIEAALSAQTVTDWVLSSDDEDILNIGNEYEQLQCLIRPAEIADDHAPAISYVRHALAELATNYAGIVIVQVTSPFTRAADIDGCLGLLTDEGADSAATVVKLDHSLQPAKIKKMEGQTLLPYFEQEDGRMAAHELPDLYVRNGSVYVSRIETIRAGKIIGDHCLGYVMPRERSLDINDPLDFAFAAFMIDQINAH